MKFFKQLQNNGWIDLRSFVLYNHLELSSDLCSADKYKNINYNSRLHRCNTVRNTFNLLLVDIIVRSHSSARLWRVPHISTSYSSQLYTIVDWLIIRAKIRLLRFFSWTRNKHVLCYVSAISFELVYIHMRLEDKNIFEMIH